MIASERTTSYAIFTYKCNLLQWTRNHAAIGYSAGPNNFANHPLSKTSKVADIDCLNYPSSVWSNVVYNLTEGMLLCFSIKSKLLHVYAILVIIFVDMLNTF